jgi:hypothetical protein
MKRKKPRIYCWVPGCWNPPITNVRNGVGRCKEHRYVMQPAKARGLGAEWPSASVLPTNGRRG